MTKKATKKAATSRSKSAARPGDGSDELGFVAARATREGGKDAVLDDDGVKQGARFTQGEDRPGMGADWLRPDSAGFARTAVRVKKHRFFADLKPGTYANGFGSKTYAETQDDLPAVVKREIASVGAKLQQSLKGAGLLTAQLFSVPTTAISPGAGKGADPAEPRKASVGYTLTVDARHGATITQALYDASGLSVATMQVAIAE